MEIHSWPFGPLGMVALAIALFAAPAQLEGRFLVPISPGHALSVLDSLALLPLLAGIAWLYGGLWQRRVKLYDTLRQVPGASSAAVFAAGFGLGLLIASAFSSFFWWWALGATLFGVIIMVAALAAARRK